MALIFMPRKSALIILLVLGAICLPDGISKNDIKEILVALAILGYAIVSLIMERIKKKVFKNGRDHKNSV